MQGIRHFYKPTKRPIYQHQLNSLKSTGIFILFNHCIFKLIQDKHLARPNFFLTSRIKGNQFKETRKSANTDNTKTTNRIKVLSKQNSKAKLEKTKRKAKVDGI